MTDVKITPGIGETISFFQKELSENEDFVVRRFRIFDQHSAVIEVLVMEVSM